VFAEKVADVVGCILERPAARWCFPTMEDPDPPGSHPTGLPVTFYATEKRTHDTSDTAPRTCSPP
jgi:hypothetical protein